MSEGYEAQINEMAVVGSCLMLPSNFIPGLLLSQEDFCDHDLGRVFACLRCRADEGLPTDDLALVCQDLARRCSPLASDGQPWEVTLSRCLLAVSTPRAVVFHAAKIREAAVRRRAWQIGQEIQAAAGEKPLEEVARILSAGADEIATATAPDDMRPLIELAPDWFGRFAASFDQPRPGVHCGIKWLDHALGGFQPGDVVILASRPGVGKSSISTQFILHALRAGVGCALFTLEMAADSIMERMCSQATGVSHYRIRNRLCDLREMETVKSWLEAAAETHRLHVYDNVHATPETIRGQVHRLRAKDKTLGLVVIDYLQLMVAKRLRGDNREQEVAHISRSLKALARDLNVAVLALSQLRRPDEHHRKDEEPKLSDLRESGSIEQDADAVLLLHTLQVPAEPLWLGRIKCFLAKHRHGPLAGGVLVFKSDTLTFAPEAKRERPVGDGGGRIEGLGE
ncbi:MAG: DnaB-like helicase C-terminal domain-containing protein [Pseudomonadota bacterium]